MKTRFILVLGGVALLGGCATTPGACDPQNSDASLMTKLACDAGGGYRTQVEAREQQVRLDQEENALFRDVHRQLLEQQQATREELHVTEAQQHDLEQSLEQLIARLQRRTEEQLGLQHQLSDLERTLEENRHAPARDDETLAERQARLDALQQQVDRLQQSLGYQP